MQNSFIIIVIGGGRGGFIIISFCVNWVQYHYTNYLPIHVHVFVVDVKGVAPPPPHTHTQLVAERRQADFRNALHSYFVSLSRYIVSEHKERQRQLRRDRHMLQVRGWEG